MVPIVRSGFGHVCCRSGFGHVCCRRYGQMKQQRWAEAEKRKSRKKEDQCARKGRKVVRHCVLPMFCGSGGSRSRLAKAAGAEPSGQM